MIALFKKKKKEEKDLSIAFNIVPRICNELSTTVKKFSMNFCRAQESGSDLGGALRLIATVVCRRFCDSFYLYATRRLNCTTMSRDILFYREN